jgi:hypothetical protein
VNQEVPPARGELRGGDLAHLEWLHL